MLHDQSAAHKKSGCYDKNGFMSYGMKPYYWSKCSKADFAALYTEISKSSSMTWCLKEDSTACQGIPSELKPPCFDEGFPNYCSGQRAKRCPDKGARDTWCKKSCNVCCPESGCEPFPCKDKGWPNYCNWAKSNGKCGDSEPKKWCEKTCGVC